MSDKKHILVVEDNPIAVKVERMVFNQLDCQVDIAEDGSKAVEMAMSNHYDAICMDIGLPIMSGVEACKAIRQHEAENNLTPTPIVAVTGNNNPEEVSEYMEAGMQAVIRKPLNKEKAEEFLSFCKKNIKPIDE